jgi:hypothetical protein
MNVANLPKITIVTPSFNQGEFLEETILSVLDQQYPNLEYILIDGGSTDLSPLIIDRYRDRLAHVRIGPDAGQYHAVQEGIALGTGDLVAWINSDDKYHAGALWRMAEAAQSFPEHRWFAGLPSVWNQYGKLQFVNKQPPEWTRQYLRGLPENPEPWYIQQESTFFRRSIWQEAGGSFDLSLGLAADFELWLRFTRLEQVKQLNSLIGGFRIQPKQRSHVQKERYGHEVRAAIQVDGQFARTEASSAHVPPQDKRVPGSHLHRVGPEFVLATSVAPHKQYSQFLAIQTWLDAGFRVLSFNEPAEIEQLQNSFPAVEFIPVRRTAREIVGKPLVYIRDVLDHFASSGFERCGIINSDISFISTVGTLDAFSLHLKEHDAMFSSRIEVDQPRRQNVSANATAGLPTVRFGSIYVWGFDLFLLNRNAVIKILAAMPPDTPFAFGVPWWDYLVPSLAMRLKLKTSILHPPPISHPTHPANYDWRLWQLFGHIYLHTLGLAAEAPKITAFVPHVGDKQLQTISQQFVQMLIRGSTKIDLGTLIHCADAMPVNLGYGELSEDVVRQLSLGNAYGAEPFLNLAGYLRDQFALSDQRRQDQQLLQQRGVPHGS